MKANIITIANKLPNPETAFKVLLNFLVCALGFLSTSVHR